MKETAEGQSPRISFDVYAMKIAIAASLRSTCRVQVGAVLADKENKIRSTGYNGSPKGLPHCIDDGCLMISGHCKRTIHAEINAVLQAMNNVSGWTLYSSHLPCLECCKIILQSGIKRVCYHTFYYDDFCDIIQTTQIKFLEDAHIQVDQI